MRLDGKLQLLICYSFLSAPVFKKMENNKFKKTKEMNNAIKSFTSKFQRNKLRTFGLHLAPDRQLENWNTG